MAKAIPLVQTEDRNLNQIQQNITQAVNPLLANPANLGALVTGVKLVIGSNAIGHGLGRALQGWSIVRQRGVASVYDTQDSNSAPTKTLLLTSSAVVTVDIYVF